MNNTININKSWDYKNGTGFGKTKNEQSIRVLDMDSETMTVFNKLFQSTETIYLYLVFFISQSKRCVLTNELVNKLLKNTLKELKIDPISLHGLRHTHASVLLYRRISIYKELREEDTMTTVQTFVSMRKRLVNV
ncbi:hypothetical protein MHH33_07050 [Paenisporosarcina sp. FSL H8-0542]|uniref:hypothetical protein n=1 Tax=Paenisporosarcina sp. FSL H8-0542 TaxID=2921401 RepID=UPI00315A8961